MGVDLRDLILKHEINISDLRGKKLAIDAYNVIFQFLSSIRQRDGTPLMDFEGNITSHLSGLFYRTTNLMSQGILPCFVFDGKSLAEKKETIEIREKIREDARIKYKEAKEKGELEVARKYAQQTSKLTSEMVQECKDLVEAMGLPWVQAIADGEAQAAYMANKGHVWAVASQDYDSLLFGTTRLVRNLSISGRKKLPGKNIYTQVNPELIDLPETLNFLGFDITRLVKVALLIGTDFNPKGIGGIGPKNALKVVKDNKFEEYAKKIPNYKGLMEIFLKPAVITDYQLKWSEINEALIKEILVERHGFSAERVNSALNKLRKASGEQKQSGLEKFY